MSNPFKNAEEVQKKLKVLVYGASGSGKTMFALGFPGRVAVIDTEGGTELYGGRSDVQPFDVLRSKTFKEIMAALAFIEADNGKTYQTVVLDPITVVWQILIEAAGEYTNTKGNRPLVTGDGGINNRGWGVIKQRVNALYARLTNLPVHVVVTSRLKDQYDKRGDDLIKIGVAPDAEKNAPYLFDVVIRLEANEAGHRRAIIEKDRSNTLKPTINNITYADLAPIADKYTTGTRVTRRSDSGAAAEQAGDLFSDQDDPPDGGSNGHETTRQTGSATHIAVNELLDQPMTALSGIELAAVRAYSLANTDANNEKHWNNRKHWHYGDYKLNEIEDTVEVFILKMSVSHESE